VLDTESFEWETRLAADKGRQPNNSKHSIPRFLFNNQKDALIIQIYSVIKLYMFRASSLPIIRSFLLYMRHW